MVVLKESFTQANNAGLQQQAPSFEVPVAGFWRQIADGLGLTDLARYGREGAQAVWDIGKTGPNPDDAPPMMSAWEVAKSNIGVADRVHYADRPEAINPGTYNPEQEARAARRFEQTFMPAEEKIETPKMSFWQTIKANIGVADTVSYAARPKAEASTYDDEKLARDLRGRTAPGQPAALRIINGLDKAIGGFASWLGNKTLSLLGQEPRTFAMKATDVPKPPTKEEFAKMRQVPPAPPLPQKRAAVRPPPLPQTHAGQKTQVMKAVTPPPLPKTPMGGQFQAFSPRTQQLPACLLNDARQQIEQQQKAAFSPAPQPGRDGAH